MDEVPQRSDYDSPWKEVLEIYFEQFVQFFFTNAHADIDWQRGYEFLDKELQKVVHDSSLGRRYGDKLGFLIAWLPLTALFHVHLLVFSSLYPDHLASLSPRDMSLTADYLLRLFSRSAVPFCW